MAQIGLNISISGLSGKLIIRWVRASAPLAEVGRNANPSTLTFPYDAVYTIIDLQPVVYIVQLWRSDDGIALDQLIKDWSIDASKETRTTIITHQYKVGRGNTEGTIGNGDYWIDPSNGDDSLVDERLKGYTKDQLIVHEAGYGNHADAEYDLLPDGGISLLGGKTFDQDVWWFITVAFSETVTLPTNTGNPVLFAGIEVLTADRDFFVDETDNLYNKLCIANWAGNVGTVTFPDMALIPDDTHVTFQTHKGSQKYLKLQFDTGQTVRFNNEDVNFIYLARNEKISLYFKAGSCYVIDYDGNAQRRGTIVYSYSNLAALGNYVFADESTGVLNEADYPALYDFIDNKLSGNASCPLGTGAGQWSYSNAGVYENKQKFGIDTTANTFRVPHLSGLIAKLTSDPGVYQADQVGEFVHQGFRLQKSGTSNHVVVLQNIDDVPNGSPTNPNVTLNTGKENRVKSYSQKPFVVL